MCLDTVRLKNWATNRSKMGNLRFNKKLACAEHIGKLQFLIFRVSKSFLKNVGESVDDCNGKLLCKNGATFVSFANTSPYFFEIPLWLFVFHWWISTNNFWILPLFPPKMTFLVLFSNSKIFSSEVFRPIPIGHSYCSLQNLKNLLLSSVRSDFFNIVYFHLSAHYIDKQYVQINGSYVFYYMF